MDLELLLKENLALVDTNLIQTIQQIPSLLMKYHQHQQDLLQSF